MKKIIKFSANRVWRTYVGGKMLDTIEGKTNPEDTHFPEDWIGSIVEAKNVGREHITEGLANVLNDQGESQVFRELLAQDKSRLLGNSEHEEYELDDIPLVKYLDSATRLHFQAHPTREFAQQRLNSPRGKTEAYVILATRDDIKNPYIYAGFQRPPNRAQLKSWIENQDISAIEDCFDKIPVKPGDVFLIPGGRPHALGEGILMLEIMEPSDLAVRFEFERCGYVIPEAARFMNRDIDTALDVFNFDPVPPEDIEQEFKCSPQLVSDDGKGNTLEKLIGPEQTPCFSIKRTKVKGTFKRNNDAFFLGVVVEGSGTMRLGDETVSLTQFERFFCPAHVNEFEYESSEGMQILECYPGGV
ncbi:mannose-6-phosphate isomerase [Alteromonas sp. 5E99-2]|uniref:class I mannose-6-phosphate isomerase n=1 Tax=Alteromonas sp. 5E99-2 TaxID=2817683 RepID=UPI001A98862B|nr:class I mannose-6-phosphate isomerase [Alteromonas sp. 5E99-2]MBO1254405.1 mannose-6-phosphate isomerase [Alteromonas sp. 5E99-2]